MLDLKGEKLFQVRGVANGDKVIAAIDIPRGCELREVSVKVSLTGLSAKLEREVAMGYGAAAYVFEVQDPDTRETYDTLWDRFVPKYTDADIIDLDTTTANTTPFWEPGEASWEDVFELGNTPTKTFGRKKLMTFADPGSAGLRFVDQATPFEPLWIPADMFHIRNNRPLRAVKRPQVWMAAVATPAFDDTVTTRVQLVEKEWGQIQYAKSTLERALVDQLVISTDTAYVAASDVMRKYLAPNVLEEDAASFVSELLSMFGVISWTLRVPGDIEIGKVDMTP